jgi:hypothetical protein
VTSETRLTSSTGGQKGAKLQRFDLIPIGPLTELAEHFGVGAAKYADHNYRRGYPWSLSYSALSRHLTQFWAGFDYDVCSNDPEGCKHTDMDGNPFVAVREDACFNHTGSHHMTAAAWHAFALLTFKDEHPEFDDRYKAPKKLTGGDDMEPVLKAKLPETITMNFTDVSPDFLNIATGGIFFAPTEPPMTCGAAVAYWAKRLERAYEAMETPTPDGHESDEVDYAFESLERAMEGLKYNGYDGQVPVYVLPEEWKDVGYTYDSDKFDTEEPDEEPSGRPFVVVPPEPGDELIEPEHGDVVVGERAEVLEQAADTAAELSDGLQEAQVGPRFTAGPHGTEDKLFQGLDLHIDIPPLHEVQMRVNAEMIQTLARNSLQRWHNRKA